MTLFRSTIQHIVIAILGVIAVQICSANTLNTWILRNSGTVNDLWDVTYGNGQFVIVGSEGTILSSLDGTSWALHVVQSDGPYWGTDLGIAYGNGIFVATGEDDTSFPNPLIFSSTDGTNWNRLNVGTDSVYDRGSISAPSFINGQFIVLGGGWTPFAVTSLNSADGFNWSQNEMCTFQNGIPHPYNNMAYGNGLYANAVTAPSAYLAKIIRSTDGASWSAPVSFTNTSIGQIVFGNGSFIATAWDYSTASPLIAISLDGLNWDWANPGTTNSLRSIAHGSNLFVVSGNNGTISTSANGTNWIPRTTGTIETLLHVMYANGQFIATGVNGAIVTSSDGTNWAKRTTGTSAILRKAVYADGKFVVVGDNGTILTSGPGFRTNLVFITHGWNPNQPPTTDNDWIDTIANNIAGRIYQQHGGGLPTGSPVLHAPDGTLIQRLTWGESDAQRSFGITEDGESVSWDVATFFWPVSAYAPLVNLPEPSFGPRVAGMNGRILGHQLGKQIHAGGYKFVHLIGHSAGSWLIDAIADSITELDAQSGTTTVIHTTFLDAYAPISMLTELGDTADFAEQYFNMSVLPDLPFTRERLCYAYNISVTDLVDPDNDQSHSWPWKWYRKTTADPASGLLGWGFQRTLEYSGALLNHASYPRGVLLHLQSGISEGFSLGCTLANILGYTFSPLSSQVSEPTAVQFLNSQSVGLNTTTSAWIRASLTVTGAANTVEFSFQFATNSNEGALVSALFDNQLVWAISGKAALTGLNHSGSVWLGKTVVGGDHTLEFRVSSTNAQTAAVVLQNFSFSLAVGTQPELYFSHSTNGLVLSWPSIFTNAVLESATNLVESGSWLPESRTVIASGDLLNVTISNSEMIGSSSSKFFRIRQQ